MTKARELLQTEQDVTLSSGVTVHIVPFPADLMNDINAYALREFPDPIPPQKTIVVVDGTELTDDVDNPEYLAEKAKARAGREKIVVEAFIDECVKFDLESYEPDIKRIEKYTGKFPDDLSERKLKFMLKFALRTIQDFEIISSTVMGLSGVTEEDIAKRRELFRPQISRAETNEGETCGATEE